MSVKIAALAFSVTLVSASAAFSAPVTYNEDGVRTRITVQKSNNGRSFNAGYRAGLRTSATNTAVVSRVSYDRGYRDGVNADLPATTAYVAPRYVSTYNGYYSNTLDPSFPPPAYAYAPTVATSYAYAPAVATPVSYGTRMSGETMAYCAARYRSFDAVSGTYLANDGYRYTCQ